MVDNINKARQLIHTCHQWGVEEFFICPGGRNTPLIFALQGQENISLRYFFDERSAAFFALGRIKSNGHKPVAVVTTSGSAVVELYPAVIEAHYTQSPLLLVTADRPPSYRHTGAPQSINQVGIFNDHAPTIDWSVENPPNLKAIDSPTHINISFDEPLLAYPSPDNQMVHLPTPSVHGKTQPLPLSSNHQWPHFKAPLVVLGGVPEKYRPELVTQLKKINRPIYAEAPSGLRENIQLRHLILQAGSQSIERALKRGEFDSLLRVGSVPTLRFWRDLNGVQRDLPVHSVSHLPFSGLARVKTQPQSFESFFKEDNLHFEGAKKWLKWDIQKRGQLEELYKKFPNSEPSMVNLLSHQIASDEMVFLGNSLPIREWDLLCEFFHPSRKHQGQSRCQWNRRLGFELSRLHEL